MSHVSPVTVSNHCHIVRSFLSIDLDLGHGLVNHSEIKLHDQEYFRGFSVVFKYANVSGYLTILTILVFFSFPVKLNIMVFLRDGYEGMCQYSI